MTSFVYKSLLLIVFFAAIISLISGFYFLIKDSGKKSRTVRALFIRVSLCALLIIMIVYGIDAGYIQAHSPIGLQPTES